MPVKRISDACLQYTMHFTKEQELYRAPGDPHLSAEGRDSVS